MKEILYRRCKVFAKEIALTTTTTPQQIRNSFKGNQSLNFPSFGKIFEIKKMR
jgi:hypothetical protein